MSSTIKPKALPPELERVVALGDSITDGLTYPHLLKQSFIGAGYQEPIVMNAGVGGDRAADMSRRLQRDVISRDPTLVLISAGVNDSIDVEPHYYKSHIVSILDRIGALNIPVLLLTPSLVRCEDEADTPRARRIDAFRSVLRNLAQDRGLRVAEVAQAMQQSRAEGKSQWGSDGIHLDFEGYRALVRAVLDGLGFTDIPVPAAARMEPAPGLLTDWEIRQIGPDETPADAAEVEGVAYGDWQPLKLSQNEINPDWYWDLVREMGVATRLDEMYGGENFMVRTHFSIEHAQALYINAIADNIWLREGNDVWNPVVSLDETPRGWHPAPRAQVDFEPGDYALLLTCKKHFFVSLTANDSV